MSNPQYTSDCPTWTPNTPDVTFRQISKCDEVTICWDYDDPAPLQGWRVYRSNTPPSISTKQLCVSVAENEPPVDAGNFNNALYGYRGKLPGDPPSVDEVEIIKGTQCGDLANLFTETDDSEYFGVCGLNSGGSFIVNLDKPIQGIDEVSWRFQVSEASGGRGLYFYDTVTSQWLSIGGPAGSSFQTVNRTFKTTSAADQIWQNGRFTRIQFAYGGVSSAPRVFKTAFLKLYRNGVQHTISGVQPTFTIPLCSVNPFPNAPGMGSIDFDRSMKEYVQADRGAHYRLGQNAFTLDFWFSKSDSPRVYHFPCETLISCYNAEKGQRAWRVWIEPTSVTDSQTSSTIQSTDDMSVANLMIEFYENGDGTGKHDVRKIIELDDQGSPSPSSIATGLNNFSQVCILRDGNVFAVYVDGTLQLTWTNAMGIAYDDQYLILGRHFGNSDRLDQSKFNSPIPAVDGDVSYFNGQLADIRLIKDVAIYPPPGGTGPNICDDVDWPATFKIVDALPPYRRCWTDPGPPLGGRIYYKVAAVQCDEDSYTKCPEYLAVQMINRQQVPGFAVDNQTDLLSRQQEAPPTLRDVFDGWDRCDPGSSNYYASPNRGGIPHNRWYFSGGTFIQPENTSVPALIVCPPVQYQTKYTHRAIMKSTSPDDDTVGIVGAYYYDPTTGAQYALCFVRTQGGMHPRNGWGIRLLTNRGGTQYYGPNGWGDLNGWSVGGTYRNASGGNGWSGRTSAVEVVRDRNKITARCSSWRSSGSTNYAAHHEAYMSDTAVIEIDMNTTPPPPGIEGGWGAFQGPTGYGFMTQSQADSKYHDWYLHPYPGSTIYDFSLGHPGRVWEYGTNSQWYLTPDTALEAAGGFPTEFTDIISNERHVLECDDVYFKV